MSHREDAFPIILDTPFTGLCFIKSPLKQFSSVFFTQFSTYFSLPLLDANRRASLSSSTRPITDTTAAVPAVEKVANNGGLSPPHNQDTFFAVEARSRGSSLRYVLLTDGLLLYLVLASLPNLS